MVSFIEPNFLLAKGYDLFAINENNVERDLVLVIAI